MQVARTRRLTGDCWQSRRLESFRVQRESHLKPACQRHFGVLVLSEFILLWPARVTCLSGCSPQKGSQPPVPERTPQACIPELLGYLLDLIYKAQGHKMPQRRQMETRVHVGLGLGQGHSAQRTLPVPAVPGPKKDLENSREALQRARVGGGGRSLRHGPAARALLSLNFSSSLESLIQQK